MSKRNRSLIQLRDLCVDYKKLRVIDGLDLYVNRGEIVALMGPNGAGKSTVLKAIFGLVPVSGGSVHWQKNRVRPRPDEMLSRGAVYVPQGKAVFGGLTVEENLEIGGLSLKNKQEKKQRIADIISLFPILKEKRKTPARRLSGGEQQILAIGRGLMTRPRLLLLDEPSIGLAPKIIKEVFAQIKEINNRFATAVLLVEHNIRSAMSIADRVYILKQGQVAYEGKNNQINNPILKEIFLGEG